MMKDWRKYRPKIMLGFGVAFVLFFIAIAILQALGYDTRGHDPSRPKSDDQIIHEQAERLDRLTE